MRDSSLCNVDPGESTDLIQDYFFPPYITLAHIFIAYEGWKMDTRSFKQYQIQYTLDGAVEFQIEDKTMVVRKGDLVIIRPGELHSARKLEQESYSCISIVFHFGNSAFPFDQLLGGRYLFSNLEDHLIEQCVSKLVTLYQQPGIISQMECQIKFMQIITELAKRNREELELPAYLPKSKAKISQIVNYIRTHYQDEITHEDLEKLSGLSRNHLIMQFKKTTGMSTMRYLTWVRLQKIIELAVHSELSYGEIANRVGYPDVHTMGKMFKKKMGSSLTEYCASVIIERPDHPQGKPVSLS